MKIIDQRGHGSLFGSKNKNKGSSRVCNKVPLDHDQKTFAPRGISIFPLEDNTLKSASAIDMNVEEQDVETINKNSTTREFVT